MSRTPIDPKLIHKPENVKRDLALLASLERLVPRQLAETVLVITEERRFTEHPPEAIDIPEVSDEDLKDAPQDVQDFAKGLSGIHIPAPTKQESLSLESFEVTNLCTQLANTWLTLLDLAGRKDGAPNPIRLTENLLPEDVPDFNITDKGIRRKAESSREALAYFMGQNLGKADTHALYLAFVSNVRAFIKRRGEILLPQDIVVGRDENGYYARRQSL